MFGTRSPPLRKSLRQKGPTWLKKNTREQHFCRNVKRKEKDQDDTQKERSQEKKEKKERNAKKRSVVLAVPVAEPELVIRVLVPAHPKGASLISTPAVGGR